MRAYTEELFGPAAVVYKVRDEEEAVELANNSDYGLGAAVFSGDLDRARSVADRLEAGMVWVNQPTASFPDLPFGGVKRSGYGRELSELGMFEFANRRLVAHGAGQEGGQAGRPADPERAVRHGGPGRMRA